MSNREQRNAPPGAPPAGSSAPPRAGQLADDLTAVLKLIATQNAEAHSSEKHADRFVEGIEGGHRSVAGKPMSDLSQSAAIDQIQDEISALEDRLEGLRLHLAQSDAGELWDPDRAEALTQTYEAADFETSSHDSNVTSPAASGGDRDWFQKRLAEIAAMVERSLSEARDSRPVGRIDGRLEDMEARICQALDGLATPSDIEKLRSAVADLGSMASQFDRAAGQLSRLDTIEGNIEAVLDRLSDERFYIDPESAESRRCASKAFADATADRIVARLTELGLESMGSGELSEIRQTIDAMMEERRRHDEQSTAILDTLQQAMISVLDRVDALTQSLESKYDIQIDTFDGQPTFESPPQASDRAVRSAEAGDPPRRSAQVREGTSDFLPTAYQEWSTDAGSAAEDDESYSDSALLPLEIDGTLDGVEGRSEIGAEARPELNAIDRIRQELIADAKRAKQKATERAARASAASAGASEHLGSVAPTLPADNRRKKQSPRKPAARQSSGTIFGVQRRKLLVGAVIILFATAGALMMMRAVSSDAPSDAPVKMEQSLSGEPGSRGRDGEAPASSPSEALPGHESGNGQIESGTRETGHADFAPFHDDAPSSDASPALASNLRGITLQSSRALTPEQYAMLDEKQTMAQLSEKLGGSAANATPAAVLPQESVDPAVGGSIGNADSSSAMATRTPLNLPPATVGPMSLRLAAAKGDPSAEFEVGARLAEGKGTDQDFKEAARWYQRSAAQGFAQAQYRLGTLYERGLGLPRDLARAAVWYQRAADNGNIKAMHNLGVLSTQSNAGEPDYASAIRWFASAADRGLADSQYNLAILHENGLGTGKDLKLAYLYFSLAARSGDQQAKQRQTVLRSQLTASDLQMAERMVESWSRKPADRLANDARAAGEDWKSRADNRHDG